MRVLEGCLENGILPVRTLAQQRGVAEVAYVRSFAYFGIAVVIFCIFAQIHHVQTLSLTVPGCHAVVGELSVTSLTTLGGNQHDTVSTLSTVNGGGRSVFQNLHRDDVGRVDS